MNAARPVVAVSAMTGLLARALTRAVLIGSLALSSAAHALMAGSQETLPSDTPAARVDPNLESSPWAGVGSLSVKGGTYSGVAVNAWQVLTAAHVVAGVAPGDVMFNLNFGGALRYRIPASAVTVHPGYGKHQFGGVNLDDLALVTLSAPLPEGVPHYALLDHPLDIGAIVTLVGYGASGDGARGVSVGGNPSVKRVGRNVIDRFFPPAKRFELPRGYLFDFDDPDGKVNRLGGASLGNRAETMVASGDSGSPAFAWVDGAYQLAGINTFTITTEGVPRGTVRFGTLGGGMWLPAYRDWLLDNMRSAAAPTPEGFALPGPPGVWWVAGILGLIGGLRRLRHAR